ncbi:MAG: hypothetical protein WBO28_05805 [Flavobacteriales bacterium]|jgi:hypothetical protein|nr:hypothetical protein [Flavobacteriales bacterium]
MNIRTVATFILLATTSIQVFSQNEEDALRLSNTLPGGTARSWALGGAMGAVGADPGSATTNPAGFGLYNTSEVSFTPQFEVNTAKSLYYGTSTTATDNRFSFNNLSLMLSYPSSKESDWRGGIFGVSFDRQASYHFDEHAVGKSISSSLLDKFVNEANGTPPGSLADLTSSNAYLAYEGYGINPLDTNSNSYYSAIPQGATTDQDQRITGAGRVNTTSFFYAANYKDRFYIGGSLGIAGVRYERETTHGETVSDTTSDINQLAYTERLLTSGSGIDLKFGVIGRVADNLRLGLAFHSPTWLQLSDSYNYTMTTGFNTPDANGNKSYSNDSPDGSFNYRVRTPWHVLASAAYVAGKHGLVSVDYEYTDFRQMKLNKSLDGLDDYSFGKENTAVQDDFRGVHSLRVGTEWRSGNWYFRGGAGVWPNAYADIDPRQGTAYMRYSGGIGYRTQHISLDLTGVYGTGEMNYYQYDPALVQATNVTRTDTRGMVTFAYRP